MLELLSHKNYSKKLIDRKLSGGVGIDSEYTENEGLNEEKLLWRKNQEKLFASKKSCSW